MPGAKSYLTGCSVSVIPWQVIAGTFHCHGLLPVTSLLLETHFPRWKQTWILSKPWSVLSFCFTVFYVV